MRWVLRRVLPALLFASLAMPAVAAWHEARSSHFIIYSDQSPGELKRFAEQLERFDQAVRYVRGMEDPALTDANRLRIYVLRNESAIAKLAGSRMIRGFYHARASGAVAFVPRTSGSKHVDWDLDTQAIFFHEYAHHLQLKTAAVAVPAWMVEGFAEFFATAQVDKNGSVTIGLPPQYRAYGILVSSDLKLDQMLGASYRKLTADQVDELYGKGWLLVHYMNFKDERRSQLAKYLEAIHKGNMLNVSAERLLASTNKPTGEDFYGWYTVGWLLNHYLSFDPQRNVQLKQYLRAINQGTKPGDAARQAFGDLDKLDREITKYKSGRLPGIDVKIANFSPPSAEMRKLGPDEEAIMKVRMRSKRGVDKNLAPGVARDARAVAEQYPNSYAVQLALAEAELDLSDFEPQNLTRAEAAADRALAIKPDSVEAMLLKGRALLERGKKEKGQLAEARKWFAKAYNEDSEHPAPLFYNYLAHYEEGGAIPESALIGLEKAYDYALFDPQIKVVLARQLLAEKKGDLARSILMPYAIAPHEGKGAKKMRDVVDLIEAKKVDEAYKLLAGEMAEAERKRKAGEDD